jgi:hypothetical protein
MKLVLILVVNSTIEKVDERSLYSTKLLQYDLKDVTASFLSNKMLKGFENVQ